MKQQVVRISASTPFLAAFLEKRLELEEFKVEAAAGGDALVSAALEMKTDIVIVQADISGMNGFDVCRKLNSEDRTKGIPVIILSGDGAHEEKAFGAGAVAFLAIPFNEQDLIDSVHRALNKKKCVLLVDDSKVIHQRTGGFLREKGFVVIDAENGEEGFKLAKRHRPDLIISDVEMPVMDGFQMCKKVKTSDETALIPVIIVSSLGQGIDIDKGFDAGANDYLIKPVVHDELLSCANSLLRTMEVRRRETILIVDDSATILNMLKFGLAQQGFNVIACQDGEDAFAKAVDLMPDVIIADLDMPGLNGYQLVKYLRERPDTRGIPIMIISSRESRGEAASGLRIGAATFISKPFSMDKVISKVERLTAELRIEREREVMKLYISEAAMEAVSRGAVDYKSSSSGFNAAEKELTILFSDIVGFTAYCEKNTPAQTVSMLNSYFDVMTEAIKEHGGIIDKFIGDAIMAIFGADDQQENQMQRAVKAGLAMLYKQKILNQESSQNIQTRIGINSGRVIFGDIGSRFYRRDYTVIGDQVNIAQRLQSKAVPDSVLISGSVYKGLAGKFETRAIGSLKLKGKEMEIETYAALGVI